MAPTLAPHIHWAERLEYVLDDGDALQVFLNWLKNDTTMSEHPVYLHFSIIAYKNKCSTNDPRTFELAENIFNKFLRVNGGLCAFIPDAVRDGIGSKLKQMSSMVPDAALFDTSLPYVDAYLRKQHALFVRSEEFLEFVNAMSASCYSDMGILPGASTSTPITSRFAPPPSGVTPPTLPSRRHRRTHQETPKLTAEALMKSQFDRENALGESTVEKLFKQTTKYPYVCNATTSKNDSAVSSSFSSDANRRTGANSAHKLAVLREEHRRENPITATILPRPERNEIGEKFDHFSEEGRKIFAELLIKKLTIVSAKKKHSDAMNEQLKEIEQKKFSARDVIKANACENIAADVDDDDDVENYVKQRMIDDSMKASPSQQSPTIPMSIRSRRRSPKSTSPERIPYYPQPAMPPLMTQSCMNHYGLTGFAPPPAAALGCPSTRPCRYPYGFSPTPGAVPGFAKTPGAMNPLRYDQDCDTSGIGSMTTTLLSNTSSIQEKHRAAIFQKARELSSANTNPMTASTTNTPPMANRTIEATEKPLFSTTITQKKRTHDFSSLPRLKSSSGRAMAADLITISYKDKEGVPVVAYVPRSNLTLKEFRKFLSISSKHKKQFFFKSSCEDDSAPYQLLLINDDSTVLPVFEGKITAECKSLSDSE